jgi:hypothetical protein
LVTTALGAETKEKLMKLQLLGGALAILFAVAVGGCSGAGPDADEASFDAGGAAATRASALSVAGAPVELPPGSVVQDPGTVVGSPIDTTDNLGKNKCTPEKQVACDACVAQCDPLCDKKNGGGPAGGCIGLFCPTKCDACVLGCFTSCGKCTPMIYQ